MADACENSDFYIVCAFSQLERLCYHIFQCNFVSASSEHDAISWSLRKRTLVSSSTHNLGANQGESASMLDQLVGTSQGPMANFSQALVTDQVAILSLVQPLHVGTVITVTAYATSPIWVQITREGTPSIETQMTTPIPVTLPSGILQTATSGPSATIAPRPLCVEGVSNAT